MTHIALYRRFRPENFDDVVGQKALIDTLRGQIMNGRVNHAYLFCGPRGIGKTSVARILSKAINCENPDNGNFCGKCNACISLKNQNNFDIIEIDAASNNGVDNIRDLRENIKFMPAAGKYRVYIIDEVHMLSISAFNALLKTLEEPPAHIVFIMATTEPNKLPITVLSRCQRFDFNRFKASDIIKLLKKVSKEAGIKIDTKAIETIARASEGGARDALSLLDQCNAFTDGEITQDNVSAILGSANRLMYFALAESILMQDTARALRGFGKMLDDGCNTLSLSRDLMGHFRDLFIAKHVTDVSEILAVDDVTASRLKSQAEKAGEGVLIRCIDLFSRLESDLRYASHPRIFIELAIAKACRSEKENSYESLLERIEKLENKINSGEVLLHDKKTVVEDKNKISNQDSDDSKQEYDEVIMYGEPPSENEIDEYFPYTDDLPVKKVKTEQKKQSGTPSLPDSVNEASDNKDKKKKEKTEVKKSKTDGSTKEAKNIWTKATDLVKSKKIMSVATAMKKAIPKSISDDTLVISYDENLTGLKRIEEKDNIRLINEVLAEVAGKPVSIKIERLILDEEEIKFNEDISKFPKDLVNKKN